MKMCSQQIGASIPLWVHLHLVWFMLRGKRLNSTTDKEVVVLVMLSDKNVFLIYHQQLILNSNVEQNLQQQRQLETLI